MGKYKKFLYVFVIVLGFAFMPKAKADMLYPYYASPSYSQQLKYGAYLPRADYPKNNTTTTYSYYFWFDTLYDQELAGLDITNSYRYAVFEACYDDKDNFTLSFSNSSNYGISANGVQILDTGISCATTEYNDYTIHFIYANILGFEFDDVYTDFYYLPFKISIKNPQSNNRTFYSRGFYITTENTYSSDLAKYEDLRQSIENNKLLESSIQKQQDIINKQSETNSKLDSVNSNLNANKQAVENQTNTMKDSNTNGATNSAGSFFSGFQTDTFGLTSIITAPINLITSITSSTCAPVGLPIPFVDNMTLNLPCIRGIYEQHFGSLLSIYQTITFGIVAYWVCIRIFALVKDFKNPEHDEIEVLDL